MDNIRKIFDSDEGTFLVKKHLSEDQYFNQPGPSSRSDEAKDQDEELPTDLSVSGSARRKHPAKITSAVVVQEFKNKNRPPPLMSLSLTSDSPQKTGGLADCGGEGERSGAWRGSIRLVLIGMLLRTSQFLTSISTRQTRTTKVGVDLVARDRGMVQSPRRCQFWRRQDGLHHLELPHPGPRSWGRCCARRLQHLWTGVVLSGRGQLGLTWTNCHPQFPRYIRGQWCLKQVLSLYLHTPPEQLLRKIKCSGHTANAEGLQIQVETWGDMSQLFW